MTTFRPSLAALCALGVVMVLAAGCESAVGNRLTETQADQILVALGERGIGAVKEAESGGGDEARYRVVVPSDDASRALALMRAADLPRREDPGLNDVFGQGSLVPTATEERARFTAALSGELARSIETIDGVLDARVHLALPDSRDVALDEAPIRPRASVLIKHRAGAAPYREDAIRALVSGAVQGMQPEDVAVVGVAAPAMPQATSAIVHVGPLAVTRGSAGTIKWVLGASLALHLVMALVLAGVVARSRRKRADAPTAEPS